LYSPGSDTTDQAEPVNPYEEALAAVGLVAAPGSLPVDEEFFLWPENLDMFNFWMRVQTQWQIGPEGRYAGLNYAGVDVCLRRQVRKSLRDEYFSMTQAMEQAAISAMHKKQ
jgi:hypothetical protein